MCIYLFVEVLKALDIFGFGFTSLVVSPMDGDGGGVACTAATTGNVAVTPRRPELLLGLRGVGVVDIIGKDQWRPTDTINKRYLVINNISQIVYHYTSAYLNNFGGQPTNRAGEWTGKRVLPLWSVLRHWRFNSGCKGRSENFRIDGHPRVVSAGGGGGGGVEVKNQQ